MGMIGSVGKKISRKIFFNGSFQIDFCCIYEKVSISCGNLRIWRVTKFKYSYLFYSHLAIYYALFYLEIEFELGFLPNALLNISYSCLFICYSAVAGPQPG